MKNSFMATVLLTSIMLTCSLMLMPFGIIGFACAILYAQLIEWFVHGWIQHHPFRIFRAYRMAHNDHHKQPNKPQSVQPVQYFIIGSMFLLFPFYQIDGFVSGYLFAYIVVNIVHYDLHAKNKFIPSFIWNTWVFKCISSHHLAHHIGTKLPYTAHSVTNPLIDMALSKIKIPNINNWIARRLKI